MNSMKETEEKLREAACIGNEDIVRDMLQSGADINSKNPMNGWTALHWAAKRGNVSVLSILLANGANKEITNDKGERPVDIAQSKEVVLVLGGDPTTLSDASNGHSSLPFTPNYLTNPVFPYSGSDSSMASKSFPNDIQHNPNLHMQSYSRVSQPSSQQDELVLKARVANAVEKDFIEIELPQQKLTMENLLNTMCQELQVHRSLVTKLRKLPDTIVRKDKDVARLTNFQELEIVLNNKYISESSRNYKPTVSPRNESIVY